MSAQAINPAPSPAPGPAASASSSGAQGPNGQGAPQGFEVILTALSDGQTRADDATGPRGTTTNGKTGGKPVGGKVSGGDGKATVASEDPKAGADATAGAATATVDPSLVVQIPVLPAVPIQTLAAGAADPTAGQAAAALATSTDGAAQTAVGALAKLTAGSAAAKTDPPAQGATPSDLAAALTADSAAANATATVKTALATPKTEAAATPAQTPAQPVAPQASAAQPSAEPVVVQAQLQTPDATAAATAAALQAPAAANAQAAQPDAPKPVAAKGSRIDITKTAAAPGAPATAAAETATPALGSSAKAADALAAGADQALKAAIEDPSQGPVLEAKSDAAAPAASPADPNATAATTTPATLIQAAAVAVRGAPQTVANLAAQIVKKLDGRTSQFDVQLDPAGLGKVDVRIAIGADGRMSAAMRFDTPQAAAELKSRSAELQQAMEQAGFDLSGGMSFDVASGRGQGGQAHDQQPEAGAAFRGRAFQTALDATADANPPPQLTLRRTALAGVDIRI